MTREEGAAKLREYHREDRRKARREGVDIAYCPYTTAAPSDSKCGVQPAVEWLKGWHEEPIVPLPISDNPHAGDFAKAILEQLTAQFGLTFEQLNGRTVGRVNRFPAEFRPNVDDYVHPEIVVLRERSERLARRAMDVYRREYASICAIYLIGHDPQRLLEDKRER